VQDGEELTGVSDSVLLQKGLGQLGSLNMIGAFGSFNEMVKRNPQHQTGNLGMAISRIGAVISDLNPGTNPDKLETMKEVLDRFGFEQIGRSLNNFTAEAPVFPDKSSPVRCYHFPSNSPTPNEFKAYLKEKISPQIQAALGNLNLITSDFIMDLSGSPMVIGKFIFAGEVDYSDVLVFKSVLEGTLIWFSILEIYNIEFDLDEFLNGYCEKVDPITYQQTVIEDFLKRYPDFGKIENALALNSLKALADQAVDYAIASVDSMVNEPSSQIPELILIDPSNYGEVRAVWENVKKSFNGPVTFNQGTLDEFTINGAPFFAGINLRDFSPSFIENSVVYSSIRNGFDPTFSGVSPNTTSEDIVRFFDEFAPNIQFVNLSTLETNPVSFQIQADDIETLADNSTQIGSGIDSSSLNIFFSCSPIPCSVTGQDSSGQPLTVNNSGPIGPLFNVSAPNINGIHTISPNGGFLTFNKGSSSSILVDLSGTILTDILGNSSFYIRKFMVQ